MSSENPVQNVAAPANNHGTQVQRQNTFGVFLVIRLLRDVIFIPARLQMSRILQKTEQELLKHVNHCTDLDSCFGKVLPLTLAKTIDR